MDEIKLNFSEDNLILMNILLGFIMFGVALNLKFDDFKRIAENPKPTIIGVISQFLLLPFLTFILILIAKPHVSISLGMILVAACPGGNISNFISQLSKANIALSVSLTAISTLLAAFMTPFNFTFWGNLIPGANNYLRETIELNFLDMFLTIVQLILIPATIGIFTAKQFPNFADKIKKSVSRLSIIIFSLFVIISFTKNFDVFSTHIHKVIIFVFFHNLIALASGYYLAKFSKLPLADCKSISIETGIQNSGLALVIIFNFFEGEGLMALVAAWWAIWHIISGLSISFFWSKKAI
jgi:BASS family bile acid:Na+ symporter